MHEGDECVPVLPSEPCGDGLMAVPGETECREVAPCPEGQWGDIPVDGTTLFVDESFMGTSDGSAMAPFTSIQDAVDASTPGAIVAIADGVYSESVSVATHAVRLWGRCPRNVTIVGQGIAAVQVNIVAPGTEVHDLSLRGVGAGLLVAGAADVLAERLWVHDTIVPGIDIEETGAPASLTVRGSLVERTTIIGAASLGAELTIERSVIRDVVPNAGNPAATGVYARLGNGAGTPATVEVRQALVERIFGYGVYADASSASLDSTLIRDIFARPSDSLLGRGIDGELDAHVGLSRSRIERTQESAIHLTASHATLDAVTIADAQASPLDRTGGRGINAQLDPESGARSSMTMRSSVVHHCRDFGVFLAGTDADIEASVVRDISPQEADGFFGRGIALQSYAVSPGPLTLAVRSSVVARCHEVGIMASGGELTVERTAVHDVFPAPADQRLGRGIVAQLDIDAQVPSNAQVLASLVARTVEGGVFVAGSTLVLRDSEIRDTKAQALEGTFGDGLTVITAIGPAAGEVTRCRIAGSARAGIANFGASVTVADTSLECNNIGLDGEHDYHFENVGGNRCGCGDTYEECQVLSSNLEPPEEL